MFLAFEEGNELKSLEQLRAFIKRYDVEYPVLFAGDLRLGEVMAEIQRLLAEQWRSFQSFRWPFLAVPLVVEQYEVEL